MGEGGEAQTKILNFEEKWRFQFLPHLALKTSFNSINHKLYNTVFKFDGRGRGAQTKILNFEEKWRFQFLPHLALRTSFNSVNHKLYN